MDDSGKDDGNEDKEEDKDKDGNCLICLQTLEDTTAGYCFEIKLERHYKYDSVVVISVSIKYKNDKIGHLQGLVIDRNFRPRWQFHKLCDTESQELQEMSICFCNDDGLLRYKDLDGFTKEQDGAASGGGFLQIEQVSISTTHRCKDLGVRCVKQLLEWLNERDACQCQEHKQAFEDAHPPPGDVDAMLTWLESEKPLYKTLHAGWLIVVLQPGLENREEDCDRWHEEHI